MEKCKKIGDIFGWTAKKVQLWNYRIRKLNGIVIDRTKSAIKRTDRFDHKKR